MLTVKTLSGSPQALARIDYTDGSYIAINGNEATIINPPDFLSTADATLGYGIQINPSQMQVYGTFPNVLGGADVSGTLVSGSTDRIARVADPVNAAKKCWKMRCAKTDPDTSSADSKRAEFSYAKPLINYGDVITCGFKYRIGDYPAHTDEFIFAQIHAGGASTLTYPWLAFYFKDNAPRIDVRFNNTVVSSIACTHLPDQWVKVVVVTKWHATTGFVKCYIDGVLKVNYTGSVAENQISSASYWKSGIYEWSASVQWDNAFLVREVFMKGLYVASGDVFTDMNTFLDYL